MRQLAIALCIIGLLAACNLQDAGQDRTTETAQSLTIEAETAQPTNTPTATASPQPTTTPRPTSTLIPTAAAPACVTRNDWQTYTIQAGDTLASIARRTDSTVTALTNANCLLDPNRLEVGQVIRVPRQPAPVELPLVGQVAGMPPLGVCWASNPGGAAIVYGKPGTGSEVIARLGNRALVINTAGNPTAADGLWLQIDFVGGANIPDGTGWVRYGTVNLLGPCTETIGIEVNSFLPGIGNPTTNIPNDQCVLIPRAGQTTYIYVGTDLQVRLARLAGYMTVTNTTTTAYQVQFDPGGYTGYVPRSEVDTANCAFTNDA